MSFLFFPFAVPACQFLCSASEHSSDPLNPPGIRRVRESVGIRVLWLWLPNVGCGAPVSTLCHQVPLISHQRAQHTHRFPPDGTNLAASRNCAAVGSTRNLSGRIFCPVPALAPAAGYPPAAVANLALPAPRAGQSNTLLVLSIATDSTCRAFSHSAMRISSAVVALKRGCFANASVSRWSAHPVLLA